MNMHVCGNIFGLLRALVDNGEGWVGQGSSLCTSGSFTIVQIYTNGKRQIGHAWYVEQIREQQVSIGSKRLMKAMRINVSLQFPRLK